MKMKVHINTTLFLGTRLSVKNRIITQCKQFTCSGCRDNMTSFRQIYMFAVGGRITRSYYSVHVYNKSICVR